MAFSAGNGGGGNGRGRFRGAPGSISEINVVPLVDVVLVLLIIFMLTAHVMEFGLEIEVPKVRQTRDTARELPVISITRTGETHLNDKLVNINLMAESVRRQFPGAKAVYVRADKDTSWEAVAQVFSQLGESGLAVQAVTQPLEQAPRRR